MESSTRVQPLRGDAETTDEMTAFQDVVLFLGGYVIPFILTLGIMGNMFSFAIFIRSRKRRDAPVQYLSCLAITDSGVILTLGVSHWLNYGLSYISGGQYSYDIVTYSNFTCKAFSFLWHVCGCISAWLIVAFSVERAYIVWFPLQRALITKRKRSSAIAVICFLSTCVSIHRLVFTRAHVIFGTDACWYTETPFLIFTLWQVDSLFLTYLPCCFIFFANICILIGVARSRRSVSGKVKGQGQEGRTILSLMLVSVFYLVFMLPASVSFSYQLFLLIFPYDVNFLVSLSHLVAFFDTFSMLNYSFNFIIYGCTLPFYRDEARVMLKIGERNKH